MIDTLLLDITTHCDRHCDECCCAIHIHRKPVHHPWSYFEHVAQFFQGIDRVHLTGGEPTLHPQFGEFLPRFKPLFGCRSLTLSTNGWGVGTYQGVIAEYADEVYFTDYHDRPWALEVLRGCTKQLIVNNGDRHISRARRGSGRSCDRAYGAATYADGRMWGCCVAPGIEGAENIEPCADWRERMMEIPLPCRDCWFSP